MPVRDSKDVGRYVARYQGNSPAKRIEVFEPGIPLLVEQEVPGGSDTFLDAQACRVRPTPYGPTGTIQLR